MPLTHLIILSLIQGLTEFLPVSSSGHLIIVPNILSWRDQGLIIDVAVHAGSLLAVVIYLWRDLWSMTAALIDFRNLRENPNLKLAQIIIIASLPVMAAGFMVSLFVDDFARNLEIIGWATLGFGILLGLSDKIGMTLNELKHMEFSDGILIGISQALALIPGASRSGLTITMARFLGYNRSAAARFSLLLAIPAILGASSLKGIELAQTQNAILSIDVAIVIMISFVAAFASISVMMNWLNKAGFMPFVIYRVVLGTGLLAWVYL
ncbi:MAG: undecaprenyl-diphosphate phosphatase [Rhodospirillaceae bacterium]|nr:undecaprenyl-diphosphate phosphatase [Rhodospirillaceae bacterium]MBT6306412.1 undecaprenyl-diphosphate phosphatase [Rhodospirillaceae bacterium]MBT7730170.1 undecaprenyl-diphosphate phosphatase [Rhodospirillaceae bacterium]